MTIFLESERLWFRALEDEDAARVTVWLNDPQVRKHLTRAFPFNVDNEREWIRKSNPLAVEGVNDHVALIFGTRGSEEPIGVGGFHGIHWVVRRAEWGIIIGDPSHSS